MVVNHGVLSPMTRIEDASVEEWKKLYDANFFSALALVSRISHSDQEDRGERTKVDSLQGQGDDPPSASF